MTNLKKLLAVIIVVAMMATLGLPALAAEMTDAEICKTIGILKGSGTGVDADYLAADTTRLQAVILTLRFMGKEADALAYEGTDSFSDAADVWWAGGQKILAYLKANPDLGWIGYTDGTFKPTSVASAKMIYKVLLVALGYVEGVDFTWANVLSFAASKGLFKVADKDMMSNDDTATAIVEAMKTAIKGDAETTLAEQLVADGVIDAEKAEDAGLYTIVPPVPPALIPLAVTTAVATNLKEIVVTFNQAVVAANVVLANFTVGGVNVEGVAQSVDLMTVTVTVPEAQADAAVNGVDYALVVKKEVGMAADTSKTVRAIDATIPEVTSVTLTGPTTFDVTFSEPINTAGTILVNNGAVGATAAAPVGNKVTVTTGVLAAGNYTIKISGYQDYAEFTIDTTEKTLAYAVNTSALTAVIGTATQTQVTVVFNKKIATALNVNHFYHTFSAWKPDAIATADNLTYTLTFTTYPIPAGAFSLTVKATDGVTAVTDVWGVSLAANTILAGTVAADATAPTVVVKQVVSEQLVKVEYSEAVAGATTAANYVVKNPAGTVVAGVTVALDTGNVYTINLGAIMAGGVYTVTISNVTDTALSPNTIVPVILGFTITDLTPPTITAVEWVDANPDIIYVTFSEAVNASATGVNSAINLNNYRINSVGGAMPTAAILMPGSTTKVKLTFADIAVTGIVVGQIADTTGNKIVALTTTVLIAAPLGSLDATNITSITTKSLSTISIVINKVIPSLAAAAFTIEQGVTAVPANVSLSNDGTNTTVVVTLTATTVLSGSADKPDNVNFLVGGLVSDIGQTNVAFTIAAGDAKMKDGISPSFASVAQPAAPVSTFEITFDEVIATTNAALSATDFIVVDKDAATWTPGTDYTVAFPVTTKAVFTIAASKNTYSGTLTISTAANVAYTTDAAANKPVAFSGKVVTIDQTVPTIVGAKTFDTNADGNVDSVQFQFSEAIDDSTFVANTFTFSDDSFVSNDAGAAITTSRIDGTVDADADDAYIVVTFAPVNALGTGVMNYRFMNVAGTDLFSNVAAQVTAATGVAATDLAKPVYKSVNEVVGGGVATLTFSENVTVPGAAGLVLTTDITGTVNAVAITQISIAQDLIVGTTLVTSLILPVGLDTEDLVVTLTAAGAGKIQDAAGNTVDTTVLTRTDADIVD